MDNNSVYEPPKATVYRFDHNDLILTASGDDPTETTQPESSEPTTPPPSDYAANALNKLFGGTNTTYEG